MKKILLYGCAAIAMLTVSSCQNDYLDLAPTNGATDDVLFQSPKEAQYVVNGLGREMMNTYLDDAWMAGECMGMEYFGEFAGDVCYKSNYSSAGGCANFTRTYWDNPAALKVYYMWYYYYKLISNANQILVNIPADPGPDAKAWDYIKGQTLAYRAYSYYMLSRVYCRRWSDKQGQSRGLVIRLTPDTSPKPCCTLAEVYEQVYKDLDEALACIENSGVKRGTSETDYWRVDSDVIHAIYSRAALTREDWQTSIDHAQKARANHPLMGLANYKAGFNVPNTEWIWCGYSNDAEQTMGGSNYFGKFSSDSSGDNSKTKCPSISKILINQIPEEDGRRWCYAVPTLEELPEAVAATQVTGACTKKTDPFYIRIARDYDDRLFHNVNTGAIATTIYYYQSFKLSCQSRLGNAQLLLFRSAEMYYNEAEAYYKLGKEKEAREALEATVKPYNPGYTCSLSGQALFDEIKLYRKFDLFLEGHCGYDQKRWGDEAWRKGWSEGGNFLPQHCSHQLPEDNHYWCFPIPNIETKYNYEIAANIEPEDWTPNK